LRCLTKKIKEDTGPKEVKKVELLMVVKDPSARLQKELAFKPLPKPAELSEAILRLDATVLGGGRAKAILENACPTPEQLSEMQAAREENPGIPWATCEAYMWEVSQIPFARARLHCVTFLAEYEEHLSPVKDSLKEFEEVCQELRSSAGMREYLACVLACGNYLNGGTNRGQADGFDLDFFSKIDLVKDQIDPKKDLRYFIAEQLSPGGVFAEAGEHVMRDVGKLSAIIRRRLIKTSEGGDTVAKQLRGGGSVEDLESRVRLLQKEFEESEELLQACLQGGDVDPADALCLEVPEKYDEARKIFDKTNLLLQSTKAEYKKVQVHFSATQTKSSDFFLLWDDAFFPKDVLIQPTKCRTITPEFCQDRGATYEHFYTLWDFKKKEDKAKKTAVAKAKAAAPEALETLRATDEWKAMSATEQEEAEAALNASAVAEAPEKKKKGKGKGKGKTAKLGQPKRSALARRSVASAARLMPLVIPTGPTGDSDEENTDTGSKSPTRVMFAEPGAQASRVSVVPPAEDVDDPERSSSLKSIETVASGTGSRSLALQNAMQRRVTRMFQPAASTFSGTATAAGSDSDDSDAPAKTF